MKNVFASLLLLVFGGAISGAARGQMTVAANTAKGHVDGSGEVVIHLVPEKLQLHMALMAKGSNLKDALPLLKQRRQAALAQLVALGAGKDSIKVASPHISEAQANYQRQMEMMMAQQLRQRGKRKKQEISLPVIINADLTAEWSLAGKTGEDALIFAQDLADKIKTADLSGAKHSEKLRPEEEELLEESQGGYTRYNSGEEKPGEPTFLYVSTISNEVREKALSEAFQKAKAEATRLAKAANAALGPLQSLSEIESMGMETQNMAEYGAGVARMMYAMQQRTGNQQKSSEAIGPNPDKVAHTVRVVASFELRNH